MEIISCFILASFSFLAAAMSMSYMKRAKKEADRVIEERTSAVHIFNEEWGNLNSNTRANQIVIDALLDHLNLAKDIIERQVIVRKKLPGEGKNF